MYKLVYSEESNKDLIIIFNYISDDSKTRDIRFLGELEKTILTLKDFPTIGKLSRYIELSSQGVYTIPHEKYLIFYRINERKKEVQIIRVLHGSKDYARLF